MTNALLDAALGYVAKGWPIFPCRSDKTPYTHNGVLDATTDPDRIKAWWAKWPLANPALDVGGAGMMVLDLDPGHDWKELESNVGSIPDTGLYSRTPRGGEHLFFGIGGSEIVSPSAGKLASHVDVRSFNSYVLLPPSRTADGIYEWLGEGRPAHRTDEMVRLANTHREKSGDRDTWLIDPDLPENIGLAVAWLKDDAKIAVEGVNGDSMCYATAAHMKSFGLSPEMAFDLMWEHWNPRCSPPWSADEVEHFQTKIENGYRYNTSPPGNITPAYRAAKASALFKPVQIDLPSGKEMHKGRFRFVDREGMHHTKPPSWLIKGMIPAKSHVVMFGASGTFKSFIALDICLTVAVGGGFPWDSDNRMVWPEVVTSGPVLYIAGEGRDQMAKRVTAWEQVHNGGKKIASDRFILVDPVPLVSEESCWEQFIEGALAMNPGGYALIVLDTVGRAMQGLNENAQEYASLFTNRLEMLRHGLGGAVMALHHTGTQEGKRERGSSVFGADADARFLVERNEKSYDVTISNVKQKDAAEWENPAAVKLVEVTLAPEVTSLVAIRPDEKTKCQIVDKSPEKRKAESRATDTLAMAAYGRVIERILSENKTRAWSDRSLAEALACDDSVEVSSDWIRKRVMPTLRENKESPARRFYDALTPNPNKWRWKA